MDKGFRETEFFRYGLQRYNIFFKTQSFFLLFGFARIKTASAIIAYSF